MRIICEQGVQYPAPDAAAVPVAAAEPVPAAAPSPWWKFGLGKPVPAPVSPAAVAPAGAADAPAEASGVAKGAWAWCKKTAEKFFPGKGRPDL